MVQIPNYRADGARLKFWARKLGVAVAAITAVIGILTLSGCKQQDRTARQILDVHAESYLECKDLNARIQARLERQIATLRERIQNPDKEAAPIDIAETKRLLEGLQRCDSEWETAVIRDMAAAGIPNAAQARAIADWREEHAGE